MDTQKTIEQLENHFWPDNKYPTNLVKRCHELRKKSIDVLTTEDLRLLIGQQIGLKIILNIAIEKLSKDILTEGDMYPGDLLNSVLDIDKDYWEQNRSQWFMVDKLILQNDSLLQDSEIRTRKFYS